MSEHQGQHDAERRAFIGKSLAAVSLASVAPGVMLGVASASSGQGGVSDQVRLGLLIDTNKCVDGCTACVDGCNKENGIDLFQKPEGQDADMWEQQRPQWIRKVKVRDRATGVVTNLPLMCQHCEKPPCVDVCPTGASLKRPDGIVMVDRHICIGCRYCMMACPYKARSFIHSDVAEKVLQAPRGKGTVESCNLCAYRMDKGADQTACQEACSTAGYGAIIYGDLRDPESAISKALKSMPSVELRPDLDLNNGVRYTRI